MGGLTRRELVAGTAAFAVVAASCAGSEAADIDGETVVAANPAGSAEPVRLDYGDHSDAFGELWLPELSDGSLPVPVVVLVHGGFWRDGFFLDLMNPLVSSLLEREYAVWNIEYRRVGAGGGYPSTFEDVAAATDHLAEIADGFAVPLDLDRVAVVGHSAGGQLAAWAAARSTLPEEAVGAGPAVLPKVVISQAGVLDLLGCVEDGVGGTACRDLVGSDPVDDPGRFAVTSPTEMVPFDAIVVVVHGELDRIVPPSQSITFVDRAAAAGMNASYVPVPDADHFSNLDPGHPAWAAVLDGLATHL